MSPPRVLITGAAGYIGSHCTLAILLQRKYKVATIDNYSNSHPEALRRVSQLANEALPPEEKDSDLAEIDMFTADLTKSEDVEMVFKQYGHGGIWCVVHVAALKSVGASASNPMPYYATNVGATTNLLQTMKTYSCTNILFSSSGSVYGSVPAAEIPIKESTRLLADSVYGRTKLMCETILQDLCFSKPDKWKAISMRYLNPAGSHPSGAIGEDPKGHLMLLPLLAQMAIGSKKATTLKIFGSDYPTPDGTCIRDYVHIMDVAHAHVLALDAFSNVSSIWRSCPTPAKYKAYNIGRGEGISVPQIVNAMRDVTGFDFKTEVVGRRSGDVAETVADTTLAKKELGFVATKHLRDMCRDLWNWQKRNPEGYGGIREY